MVFKKKCEKCDNQFLCNPETNGTCWCMSEDYVEKDKNLKDCICKECLVKQPKKISLP